MNFTNAVTTSALVLQIVLLALLIKRGIPKRFPFFFTYSVLSVLGTAVKLLVRKKAFLFFYVSWSVEALYATLAFAALYEAFQRLFAHLYEPQSLKMRFTATAVFLLGLCGLWFLLHGLPSHSIPLMRGVVMMEFASGVLQLGLGAMIMFLGTLKGHSSRRYGYGIAAGFGVAAFGPFATMLIFSEFGTRYRNLLQQVIPLAYLVAVIIWLLAFVWLEPRTSKAGPEPDPYEVMEDLRQLRRETEERYGPWLDLSSYRSGSGLR